MESRDKAFAPLEELIKESPEEAFTPEVKRQLTEKVKETKEKLITKKL